MGFSYMEAWVLPLKVKCPRCGGRLYIQGSVDGSLEDCVYCPKCGKIWTPKEFEKMLENKVIK